MDETKGDLQGGSSMEEPKKVPRRVLGLAAAAAATAATPWESRGFR